MFCLFSLILVTKLSKQMPFTSNEGRKETFDMNINSSFFMEQEIHTEEKIEKLRAKFYHF